MKLFRLLAAALAVVFPLASAQAQTQSAIANQISTQFAPNTRGAITASSLQSVLNALNNGKIGTADLSAGLATRAPIASPAFTGTPTMPTIALTAPGSTGPIDSMSVTPGALTRTLTQVLGDRMSVANYSGLDPSGTADSTSAFQAAYNAATPGQEILIPPGNYKVGAVTGSKWVRWNASGASAFPGASLFNLPGLVNYGFGAPQLVVQSQTSASDLATLSVRRNTSHTGGTPGSVSSGFRVDHTVGGPGNTGQTNFEWALTSVMNNWSSAGENVGGYLQCNNYGTGPCWGGLMEVVDKTGKPDPTSGLVTQENDLNAYGTDANGNRLLMDMVLRRPVGSESAGPRAEALTGVRFSGEHGFATPNSRYNNLITTQTALEVGNGLNLSNASVTGNAILLAGGQKIAMEPSGQNNIAFNSSIAATVFNGSVQVGNAFYIAQTTVPTSTSACTTGRVTFDSNYIYTCVNTNTWKRIAYTSGTW